MSDGITIISCSDIGASGTTDVHVRKKSKKVYEARMGIAMFGHSNMTEEALDKCGRNPFSPYFEDNYVSGIGGTEEVAIKNLKKSLKETANSLWV